MIPVWVQEWVYIASIALALGMLAGSKWIGW
jgi:hypothetical protein